LFFFFPELSWFNFVFAREYFECLEAVEDEAKRLRRSEDSFGSVHDLFRDEAQFGDYYGVTPKFLK